MSTDIYIDAAKLLQVESVTFVTDFNVGVPEAREEYGKDDPDLYYARDCLKPVMMIKFKNCTHYCELIDDQFRIPSIFGSPVFVACVDVCNMYDIPFRVVY